MQIFSTPINGLLQAEEYARAILRGAVPRANARELDTLVQVRLGRQSVIDPDRADAPPLELHAVLDESALHRGPAEGPVRPNQLRALSERSYLPNVTLQVLPFGAGHTSGTSTFAIFEPRQNSDWPVANVESRAPGPTPTSTPVRTWTGTGRSGGTSWARRSTWRSPGTWSGASPRRRRPRLGPAPGPAGSLRAEGLDVELAVPDAGHEGLPLLPGERENRSVLHPGGPHEHPVLGVRDRDAPTGVAEGTDPERCRAGQRDPDPCRSPGRRRGESPCAATRRAPGGQRCPATGTDERVTPATNPVRPR